MSFIIDTHIFLWALAAPNRIPNQWLRIKTYRQLGVCERRQHCGYNDKKSLGKLDFDSDPVVLAEETGFSLMDFSGNDALYLGSLPFHHKDPFDRMLISQSISRKIKIMTMDEKFSAYGCDLV